MGKKSFKREEFTTGDDACVAYEPLHKKWFDHTDIATTREGEPLDNPELSIYLREDWKNFLPQEKVELRHTMAKLRRSTAFDREVGDFASSMTFTASPTSDIRSVLAQAEFPRDMQLAVMDELQQMWRAKAK